MKSARHLAAACALALFCALASYVPAAAQESGAPSQKQLDRAALRAQRKAIVGDNMQLSADEAKVFWPIFEEYETRMDKIDDRHVAELKEFAKNYQTLTDDQAKKKLDEVLAIQQATLDLQNEFVPKFRDKVSQITVTRFFQVDNKLRALVQCQIAQVVPLAMPPPAQSQ